LNTANSPNAFGITPSPVDINDVLSGVYGSSASVAGTSNPSPDTVNSILNSIYPSGTASQTATSTGDAVIQAFPGPSLWTIGLALASLYVLAEYVPHGMEIALIIFIAVILETGGVADNLSSILQFVQTGL
jgi:hypothetical protein